MKKLSKKNLRSKSKPTKSRTDHPAGCRINDAERDQVMSDIADIKQASGHAPSLGSYTKHALLSHPRYRRMEVQLRKLLADEAVDSYFAGQEPLADPEGEAGRKFYNDVKAILENAR